MKSILKMLALMLTASAVLYVPALAQQPASILGKTDLAGLLESAPTVPATVESAVVKAYGANATPNSKSQLDSAYDSFKQTCCRGTQRTERRYGSTHQKHAAARSSSV